MEGKNQTAGKFRDTQTLYSAARNAYEWPSSRGTNIRGPDCPSAKTGCAGHHGVPAGYKNFVGTILPAFAGSGKYSRPYKPALLRTGRARPAAGALFAGDQGQDLDSHSSEPTARRTLERKGRAERFSKYAAHSERAAWGFGLRRDAGLSSSSTKFSGRIACNPSLGAQSELSFWPG